MDSFEAIVVGAAAAAIGTIVAMKYMNRHPAGGGEPQQPDVASYGARGGMIRVQDMPMTSRFAAPQNQNNPITEAAFNIQPVKYVPAFGPAENVAAQEGILTI